MMLITCHLILTLVLALLLILARTGEARHHGDVQHAARTSGDDAQSKWQDHVHSRVRRFRRKDSVDDCDPNHSCLLGRWCVESRETRDMERDADGNCQCRADAHTCRIEGQRKLRFHEFECLDTSAAHIGMQRGSNGDCECASGHCAGPILPHAWPNGDSGLATRNGWDMQCHLQSEFGLMRNPLDGQTCVCANEQCQRGTLVAPPRAAGVPLCVSLAPPPASSSQHSHHPGLTRHTNTGMCDCASDHCALRPPVGTSAGEANAALTCVSLASHPEFRRDDGDSDAAAGGTRGTCACAIGYCRRLGKHSEQCVREGDMYVPSGDGENGDHCVCTESHCDRGFDFESGRVCLSLAANPMLRRRSNDQRGLTVGAVPFALTPGSEAECMCAPSDDICQLGYIHQKAPLQCLSKRATGFISNEQDHCDCPKTHCMPRGDGQSAHCVAGARTVPWELGCK